MNACSRAAAMEALARTGYVDVPVDVRNAILAGGLAPGIVGHQGLRQYMKKASFYALRITNSIRLETKGDFVRFVDTMRNIRADLFYPFFCRNFWT